MGTPDAIDKSWNELFGIVKRYDIGLFVGAGLSFDNKLPSWESFAARLFAKPSSEDAIRLQEHGIPFASQIGVAHKGGNSSDEFEGDELKWIERVRECLYSEFYQDLKKNKLELADLLNMEMEKKPNDKILGFFETTNNALLEVVKMCSIRGKDGIPRIVTVLTTNLDSLLQICDRTINGSPRQLRTIERATKSSDSGKVSLYHLHGYLQPHSETKPMDEAADQLVLTEFEYTQRNDTPHHWAATTLHWALRECPCVFIGCSMNDELIRRALYRTRAHRIADANAEQSQRRIKRHSRPKHFAVCLWQEDNHIRDTLTRSYNMMDVNPLWISGYGELPSQLLKLREEIAKYG